jgi:hypothetical protein
MSERVTQSLFLMEGMVKGEKGKEKKSRLQYFLIMNPFHLHDYIRRRPYIIAVDRTTSDLHFSRAK